MQLLNRSQIYKMMNKEDRTYVYCLHRQDGAIFYVGIGKKYRCLWHVQKSSESLDFNKLKQNIINKEGRENILFQIVKFDSEENCLQLEKNLIALFGRHQFGGLLANLTDGGEKGPTGVVQSKESNEKRRATCLASVEVHREAARKQWANMSEDERNISLARMKAGVLSEEGRAAQVKARKRIHEDEDIRSRRIASLKNFYKENPEAVVQRREASKNKWKDPAFREKMAAARAAAKEKRLALKQAELNLENSA